MRNVGFGALALLGLSLPLAAQDVGLPLGTVPAEAVVQNLDGDTVSFSRFAGPGPVVVLFWATWCPVCEALTPRILAARERHGDRVRFVAVAVGVNQTRASIRRHLQRHPLPGAVCFDARGAAVRAFQAPTTSYVVALDARGRVVYTGVGEDQDIEAAAGRAAGGR